MFRQFRWFRSLYSPRGLYILRTFAVLHSENFAVLACSAVFFTVTMVTIYFCVENEGALQFSWLTTPEFRGMRAA